MTADTPPTKASTDLVDPIMRYFAYQHLPPHLQTYSKPFGDLALWIFPRAAPQPRAHRRAAQAAGGQDAAARAMFQEKSYGAHRGGNFPP